MVQYYYSDTQIRTDDIADGAVTATKLNSISSNGENGQALVSNGNGGFSWYSISNLTRVLTVGEGGEYTSITAALNAISDNSALTPYLIKVGPGIYNEQIVMKSYVDIEGCGEGITIISSSGGDETTPTVKAASNSELRLLTVECSASGAGNNATGLY